MDYEERNKQLSNLQCVMEDIKIMLEACNCLYFAPVTADVYGLLQEIVDSQELIAYFLSILSTFESSSEDHTMSSLDSQLEELLDKINDYRRHFTERLDLWELQTSQDKIQRICDVL